MLPAGASDPDVGSAELLEVPHGQVAGRPLAKVAGAGPGDQIEIYLRYLVNSRLQTPNQRAALRTVRGAEPWRIVEEDHRG